MKIVGPPFGALIEVKLPLNFDAPKGTFFKDERGHIWYLKKAFGYPELQTAAEVISSEVYRYLGYLAPETHIVVHDGVRFSASRLLPKGKDVTFKDEMPNTSQTRAMRVVAAFLKDWDRLTLEPNNRLFADGSFGVSNFTGALDSRTRSQSTRGNLVGDVLSSFGESSDIAEVFGSYRVDQLTENHPWRQFSLADAGFAIEMFRTLDRKKITEIVDKASFSDRRNRLKMIEALSSRRNTIMDQLRWYIDPNAPVQTGSYWATQTNPRPLTFEVGGNRPAYISNRVHAFVDSLILPNDQMILFRGQQAVTPIVVAPFLRPENPGRLDIPLNERDHVFSQVIKMFQTSDDARTLKTKRKESYFNLKDEVSPWAVWWDRASGLDALAVEHSVSAGSRFLISCTRSLEVASRYKDFDREKYRYRYVYIFAVPKREIVPIREIMDSMPGYPANKAEEEYAIKFDATPYIKGIYDTETDQFINMNSK